ncbi:antitoxin component YwqK of YwqJK toxin-antitoxin module [Mangrovibacterium marinum]|uniref:Antitoxin component YwqK of YwqJK toxin-antitoxin module n=3 Tax=Mangrovibacterium marinum TaxID=1639118 RepID=A0A2T5C1L4_9BACT|nr:antitoxin component YwqK of YwqJK toxin-antitoxin module [Mangrovibacterium marinum]
MVMRTMISTGLLFLAMVLPGLAQEAGNRLDENGQKQGYWEKKQPNGKFLYQGYFQDDKPVGEWKRFHTNGVLKARINYAEDSDTAAVTLFDNYGNKLADGFYLGREKAGHWVYYDKRQKVAEENYVDGKKNGTARTYYSSGELFVETNYVDGVEEGVYRAYQKSGTVYFECQMNDGRRDGYCQIFYPNGELETAAFYRAGVREDCWTYYDENGRLQYSLEYENGQVQNPAVLDSVEQIRYRQLDENRNKIMDPEQFMQDPVQYMMQQKIR